MGQVGLVVAAVCSVGSCAVAGVLVGRRIRSRCKWGRALDVLSEFEEGCSTSAARLHHVVDAMAVEMHAGLTSDGGSKLKMLLTFVSRLPDGNEKGTYYALDLGGTNFRVLRVQLGGSRSTIIRHQVERQPIPQHLMTSTSEEFFDCIAMTLKQFVDREEGDFDQEPDRSRELGFTFSFPVKQTSVTSGILIKWTKGFAIEDTVGKNVSQCLEEAMTKKGLDMRVTALVGKNVSQCLEEAMTKKGLDMRVTALVNDTVGTLALSHFHDEDTVAAVVIGTGTNACYVEQTDAIIKCQGLLTNSGEMVVNMEWGSFWSSHLPRTSYDVELDNESTNCGDQGFEKMISGMYLGDIVRRVLYRMARESDIFGDAASKLSVPFSLRAYMMSIMHEDPSPDLREVGRILEETFLMTDLSLKARRLVVRVCDIVTRRAARLAAAGIVGILKKLGRDGSGGIAGRRSKGKAQRTVVAIEGGVYATHAFFRDYLNEAVVEILGEEVARNVIFRVSEDGSGVGAALLAAASHLSDR